MLDEIPLETACIDVPDLQPIWQDVRRSPNLCREIGRMGGNRSCSHVHKGIPGVAPSFPAMTQYVNCSQVLSYSQCHRPACTSHITSPSSALKTNTRFPWQLENCSWDTVICTQTPTPMSPAAAGHADCLLTMFESFHQKVGADSAFKPSLVRTESGGIKTSSLASWRIRLSWRICEKIGTILLKSPSIIIWLEGIVEVAEITLDVGGFE